MTQIKAPQAQPRVGLGRHLPNYHQLVPNHHQLVPNHQRQPAYRLICYCTHKSDKRISRTLFRQETGASTDPLEEIPQKVPLYLIRQSETRFKFEFSKWSRSKLLQHSYCTYQCSIISTSIKVLVGYVDSASLIESFHWTCQACFC